MDDKINQARDIYFNNLGSTFFMIRDGVLKEYRSFNISEQQEAEWRQELIAEMSLSLDNEDFTRLDKLGTIAQYHGDSVILEAIVAYIIKNLHTMDSYAQLIYANHLWELAGAASQELPGGPYNQARSIAIRLWRNIIKGQVTLKAERAGEIESGEENAEEYVKKWAERQLKAIGASKEP